MGYIEKGKITSVYGSTARVIPCSEAGLVSAQVVVPWYLRSGAISKGTEVVYAIFDDQSGIILGRADGNLPDLVLGGVSLKTHTHPITEGDPATGRPT
jgi:hypothetical protein